MRRAKRRVALDEVSFVVFAADDEVGSGLEAEVGDVAAVPDEADGVGGKAVQRPTIRPMPKKTADNTSALSRSTAGRRSSRLNSSRAEWRGSRSTSAAYF